MLTKIRMRNEKGFTLIELLIVVAIIGILAAIAIPQFSQYRKRGYRAALQSDLKNSYTAAQAYLGDRPNKANVTVSELTSVFRPSVGITFGTDTMSTGAGYFSATHASATGLLGTIHYSGSVYVAAF